jgi:hypothetical protein
MGRGVAVLEPSTRLAFFVPIAVVAAEASAPHEPPDKDGEPRAQHGHLKTRPGLGAAQENTYRLSVPGGKTGNKRCCALSLHCDQRKGAIVKRLMSL